MVNLLGGMHLVHQRHRQRHAASGAHPVDHRHDRQMVFLQQPRKLQAHFGGQFLGQGGDGRIQLVQLGAGHADFVLGAGDDEFLELDKVIDDRLHDFLV